MKPHWNATSAKKWLKQHNYYNDEVDNKPTQIRFRQYNPEDLRNRHFISKKLKDENIILIISTMSNSGSGIMLNNFEFLDPKEIKALEHKAFFDAQLKHKKASERLEKEMAERMKNIKKATKTRVSKGSQAAKDRMKKVRAGKGLKKC
jgi:hypothetical protein